MFRALTVVIMLASCKSAPKETPTRADSAGSQPGAPGSGTGAALPAPGDYSRSGAGDITGTLSIKSIDDKQLEFELELSDPDAHTGEARGVAVKASDRSYAYTDEDCKLTFVVESATKLQVTQDGGCDFGEGIDANAVFSR